MIQDPKGPSPTGPRDPGGSLQFLSGGGEMGMRMRKHHWSRTPLGDPGRWPNSLRTTVGILLNSRYPMFLAWGPELALLYNDAYLPVFGEKHPDALGRPFQEVWGEIWDDIAPLVERALAGEPTWSENMQLFMERRGFPEEVYFTFSYSPVRADDGRVGGMFCACTETTAEVVGERRLKALRELAAATGDARGVEDVCALAAEVVERHAADVPFSLIYLNDPDGARARLVACSGCSPGDAFAPEVVEIRTAGLGWPYEAAVSEGGGMLHRLERQLGLPGNPWPEAADTATVIPLARSGHDEGRGFLIVGASPRLPFDEQYQRFFELLAGGVASAVSNAEAYEAERRRAEALAELDRAKTAFFSNVSHEFRTPLTLILAPLDEALDEHAPPGPLREQLAVARRNAVRLQKLVNSLLDFSRIEAGRVQASYRPTDLAALTRDLASNFRSACERAGLDLRVCCAELPEPMYVDREMWEKIVLNLISNAFKFTLTGGIEVSLGAGEGGAVLEVRDTGIGIPAEELPRIFERFHRVEGGGGRTHEGSGIGLAMVRELVRLHGGRVEAGSALGRGTVLTVTIPAGWRHLPPERVSHDASGASAGPGAAAFVQEALRWLPSDSERESADESTKAPRQETGGARVLIADDNADMRDYLARLLGEHWQVETAADGAEALAAARRRPPALVLTDVMMPKLDGFDLVGALRGDAATAGVPIIMLSARAGEEARVEGLQAGVDDYLVKPFSARELIARVSSHIALAQSARERAELVEREQAARKAARLERRHLRTLFMQAPAPVVVLRGPEHVIELANGHACRVWGRKPEEVHGRALHDALPELRGQPFGDLLERVYSTGVAEVGKETRARLDWNGDGTLQDIYFNFVYAPLRALDGSTAGVLVIAFDVTEQVHARQRTNALRHEAEEANRAKDEFLAMLGHELRNPLAPIMTALELMRLGDDDAFAHERAVIERQARQLVSLVDDLLDVSRITGGKIELAWERVDLEDVVARAIEMVSPLLEQRRHHLEVDVAHGRLFALGDPARLAQVVSNLLSNAAKYTDPEGRIRISAGVSGDQVVLTVRDNGTGISPELLPQVFDMFTQQHQGRDRSLGGLGLGLTIVRSIVSLHGGEVSAESEGEGLGSTFIVRLPALEAATEVAAATAPAAAQTRSLASRRVLVVDDNEDAARALAAYVEGLGHLARLAHDGPAALATAAAFLPEVVLLDIGLPVMDGYEVGRRLRDSAFGAGTRLIAVTGYGQPAERERSAAAGFDAHLIKPVDLAALAALLAQPQAVGET